MKNPKAVVQQFKIVTTAPNSQKVVTEQSRPGSIILILWVLLIWLVISVLRDLFGKKKAKPQASKGYTSDATNTTISYTYNYKPNQ